MPFRKLTTSRLAGCIADLVGNSAYQVQAAELGAKLRQEQGILAAVRVIETIAAASSRDLSVAENPPRIET